MNKNKLYLFIFSICVAGYFWIAYNMHLTPEQGWQNSTTPGPCLFKSTTGVPCPSCGTSRSVVSLTKGEIYKALWFNPLGIVMAAAMLLFPLWILKDRITRGSSFYRFYRHTEAFFSKRPVAILFIALLLILWIWNIIKYT